MIEQAGAPFGAGIDRSDPARPRPRFVGDTRTPPLEARYWDLGLRLKAMNRGGVACRRSPSPCRWCTSPTARAGARLGAGLQRRQAAPRTPRTPTASWAAPCCRCRTRAPALAELERAARLPGIRGRLPRAPTSAGASCPIRPSPPSSSARALGLPVLLHPDQRGRRRAARALLPGQSPGQSIRHRHRGGASGVRRRARPPAEARGVPAARGRGAALSPRAAPARAGGAARDQGRGEAALRAPTSAASPTTRSATPRRAALSDRHGRRRPGDAGQRLLLRHGLRRARADDRRPSASRLSRADQRPHPPRHRAPACSRSAEGSRADDRPEFWIIQTFNGLSYGALLFLLAERALAHLRRHAHRQPRARLLLPARAATSA